MKPLDRTFKAISVGMDGKAPDEALNGRVKYRGVDRSEVEVPFGEKDQVSFIVIASFIFFRTREIKSESFTSGK